MAERERLAFELTADERAAAQARHRVVAAARACVRDEGADTLGLLVSEIVTNAVVHGGEGRALEVVASLSERSVRVEVCDDGEGFVPHPRALAPDDVGGWGLFLVEQLASSWGVSFSGRTTVWFELPCLPVARAA
ncbi:MAG: ATP-binding protein [Thermoleophilaceae bacterium]